MKKLITLLLVSVIAAGCNSDESENPNGQDMTSAEVSARIVEIGNAASADILSMVQSEGVTALLSLVELFADFDEFSSKPDQRKWTKEKLDIITRYFITGPTARVTDDDFSFDDIKGIYEWNPNSEEFERTGESPSFIVLFPAEGSETNNAALEITDLQFVTFNEVDEWGSYQVTLPTSFDGSLAVDEVTYITLTASANWLDDGLPESASVDLFLSPFRFNMNFDDSNAISSSLSASLTKEATTLMGVDLNVDFNSAEKVEPANIDGFVEYGGLKLSGNIDIAGIESGLYDEFGEMKDGFNLNDYIDLEVLLDDVKVGDILVEEDIIYIVYLDGEREILEQLLESIIAEIDSSMEDVFEGISSNQNIEG